jgi:aspartyl/asparaginyl-tRNA synthetase
VNVNDIKWQKAYNEVVNKMRFFFREAKGFTEITGQDNLSILAACEDPSTISQFIFDGINWPLPQTNQMNLETILLNNPSLKGVFCITTSYRNEPNPIPGRHDKIFPMFEFESHGNMDDLISIEEELLSHLGFGESLDFTNITYDDACNKYGVSELDVDEEDKMCKDFSTCTFLTDFPQRTHPFWNMKQNETDKNLFNKVDVIMHGMETIGSAERSTNVEEMREQFHTISDGEYAQLLFNHFGRKRVEDELEEYLKLEMFPRFGAGIGVTRMVRAMGLQGLLNKQ